MAVSVEPSCDCEESGEDERLDEQMMHTDLTPEAIERVFNEVDRDHNGLLTPAELHDAYVRLGIKVTQQDVDQLLKRIHDKCLDCKDDDDTTVSLREFQKYCFHRQKEIRHVFNRIKSRAHEETFEGNAHCGVTLQGLRRALKELNIDASHEELVSFLDHVDRNRDGVMQYEEFRDFLLLLPACNVRALFESFWKDHLPGIDAIQPEWSIRQHCFERSKETGEQHPGNVMESIYAKLYSGGVAGAVSRTFTAPFDRIRILMQAGSTATNALAVAKDELAKGGIVSLWRGNGVNCIKIIPETALRYTLFDAIRPLIASDVDDMSPMERFACGGVAGMISQGAIYPLEIVRTRFALAPSNTYSSTVQCVRDIFQKEGIRQLYSGLRISLIGMIPFAGIDLSLNSLLRERTAQYFEAKRRFVPPDAVVMLSCGVVSSSVAMIATFPLGLLRTKLQVYVYPKSFAEIVNLGLRNARFRQVRRLFGCSSPNLS